MVEGLWGYHEAASAQPAARACKQAAGGSKHSSYFFKLKLSRPPSRRTFATRSIWRSTYARTCGRHSSGSISW